MATTAIGGQAATVVLCKGVAVSATTRLVPPSRTGRPTYYYRTTGGTRASTTSASAIPAGATIEQVTT